MNNDSEKFMDKVITDGDLSKLSHTDRVAYYNKVCDSLGLNPLTKPFNYILLDSGKSGEDKRLTLYATKDCTEQLRKNNGISLTITSREFIGDLYIVTARAVDKTGRMDESIGAVSLKYKKFDPASKQYKYIDAMGDFKANLLMKAETKAKRRVTLSISGLGFIDESETDSIPASKIISEPELELMDKDKKDLLSTLNGLIKDYDIPNETQMKWMEWFDVTSLKDLNEENLTKLILQIKKRHESVNHQEVNLNEK
jgi:hypothetical protein